MVQSMVELKVDSKVVHLVDEMGHWMVVTTVAEKVPEMAELMVE